MKRSDIHAAFVRQFSFPRLKSAAPVTEAGIQAVEKELQTTFPTSYRSFIVKHGPLFTPAILELSVAAHEASGHPEEEVFDVREFLQPHEIVPIYRGSVSAGMDDSLIPFAMDSGGSYFGFRRWLRSSNQDDSPVLFFDHDFPTVSEFVTSR